MKQEKTASQPTKPTAHERAEKNDIRKYYINEAYIAPSLLFDLLLSTMLRKFSHRRPKTRNTAINIGGDAYEMATGCLFNNYCYWDLDRHKNSQILTFQ